MKTNNRTVIGRRRGYGRLLLKKTWFEISEIPRAHWKGTFRLHRPDISHRVFGYCSCKQDTKERHWGQQFWQRALSRLVKISGISGSAVNGTRFVDSSHWKIPRKSGKYPTEMTRPVKVDHLQSWSRIFWSEPTDISGILGWMESAL